MTRAYTPPAGSLARRVIDYLTEAGGGFLTTADLRDDFGTSNPSSCLANAIKNGLLVAERNGLTFHYSLPGSDTPPPPPSDGKLTITTYFDGDVGIGGAVVAEDGSVLITREQLLQLFQHCTTPHIALPLPAPQGG